MGHQLDRKALERELAVVRRPLEHWRRTVGAPKPIPAPIWESAVQLAARHGVGVIAVGLGLDHARLKAKVDIASAAQRTAMQPASPTFVELFSKPPAVSRAAVGPCVLRIRSPRGVRVRVDLASIDASELGTMLKELL